MLAASNPLTASMRIVLLDQKVGVISCTNKISYYLQPLAITFAQLLTVTLDAKLIC